MQPFAQFRLWLQEGPRAERRAAFVAVALALVLVSLALVPVAGSGDDELVTGALAAEEPGTLPGGAAPGEAGSGAAAPGEPPPGGAGAAAPGAGPADGAGPAQGGGSVLAGVAGAGSSPGGASGSGGAPGRGAAPGAPRSQAGGAGQPVAGDACTTRLGASAPGITAKEVRIAVAQVDLAGAVGNEAFDLRQDPEEIFAAVTDHVNKTGGLACGRKLVTKLYKVNPTDSNDQQAKCLQMVQEKNYVVINNGAYATPVSYQCFVNNKLPLQHPGTVSAGQLRSSFPYLYAIGVSIEQAVRNAALGLAERGFFTKPAFRKLGLLVDSCVPDANAELARDLAASGLSKDDIVQYELDCQLVAGQNQLSQAVLQMKAENVSHVLLTVSVLNAQNFTRLAARQDLRPKYAVTDKGSSTTPNGAGNWDDSFNGGVAVTASRVGELATGIRNARVEECDKILTSRGVPGIRNEAKDSTAAGACDQLFFLRRALSVAGPNPTSASLVQNLGRIGRFETGVGTDGLWTQSNKASGGDFTRLVRWQGDCRCWKLAEREFKGRY